MQGAGIIRSGAGAVGPRGGGRDLPSGVRNTAKDRRIADPCSSPFISQPGNSMRRIDPTTAFHRSVAPCVSMALAAGLLSAFMAGSSAHAATGRPSTENAAAPRERAAPAGRRHRIARPAVQRTSSDETAAERDRRLSRECRGLPNAGACLGYTR
jgi:hypothetical protein